MLRLRNVMSSSRAAIDLASIMVGVIIIGIIGGVISATIFAVIPWAQNSAAKQQLESIHTAENAFYGLSSDANTTLKNADGSTGSFRNQFTSSDVLDANNLLMQNTKYCAVATSDGKDYNAYSRSDSGIIYVSSNLDKKVSVYPGADAPACLGGTGSDTGSGVGTTPGGDSGTTDPSTPVIPDTPITTTTTTFTINCPTGVTTAQLPWAGTINGTVTWSDGVKEVYSSATATKAARTVVSGKDYTATMDGTFTALNAALLADAPRSCLRSLDTWGTSSSTVDATQAFWNSPNLTTVPTYIPASVTTLTQMFQGDTAFNSPNVTKWNTANVRLMNSVFSGASSFNQPVGSWNLSKVTTIGGMFFNAASFNQPLNDWDTSLVSTMSSVFWGAKSFNQPLDKWNVGRVITTQTMFSNSAFNQNINNWTFTRNRNMNQMFGFATAFNQPVNDWNVSTVTDMTNVFNGATSFNQPLDKWDTSLVTVTANMFQNAKSFNQPLSSFKMDAVTNSGNMFNGASSFNQPLDSWVTSKVTYFGGMFQNASSFSQDISKWSTAGTNGTSGAVPSFKTGSPLTNAQVPALMRT